MGHDSSFDLERAKEGYIHSSHRMLISSFKTWLWLKNKYGADARLFASADVIRANIRQNANNFFNWLAHREPHIKEYHLNGRHRKSS